MAPTFLRAYPPELPTPGPAYWFPFQGDRLVVQEQGSGIVPIQSDAAGMAAVEPQAVLYLGTLNGIPCQACELHPDLALPAGWRALSLRALFGQIDDAAYGVAGYASQLLFWQRQSRFCPTCGSKTEMLPASWAQQCLNCGYIGYPPVIPAILVLVHDGGERALLTHKPGWNKLYSIIAGFVEPGESLEDCVHREVYEEVGVSVTDITYMGSQPWPFPQQLMIGYTARYTGGEVRPDLQELDDAQWFHIDALPELPAQLSLSWQIIHAWETAQREKRS